ncbi:MAG: response regulator [Acidobacteria bacterium]|nr:response regulator [Acidobacteriota bacterium]
MEKQTILLVDDDPDYLESNRAVLEAEGFDVHTAETPGQALRLVRKISPAVAILDVIMDEPDSGFKLARQIRGSRKTQNVRIVLLTALNDVNREKGIAYRFSDGDRDERWLPVDRVLNKPVRPARLAAVVHELLGGA